MQRGRKTNLILKQFRRKSKKIINKDLFTEIFYLNNDRKIIEFLIQKDTLITELFFKEFLPIEFRDFIEIKILNDAEEQIKQWYFEEENLVIIIKVNWGKEIEEISIDLNIENFIINIINDKGIAIRQIDYNLFNDFLISFLTLQARKLTTRFKSFIEI